MAWTRLMENWPATLQALAEIFPHLDTRALTNFRGCRETLEAYIADTHDLTKAEASEALEDWIGIILARQGVDLAA